MEKSLEENISKNIKDYTTKEVADICELSDILIRKYFDNGSLEGYRLLKSKHRRIPHESLIKFMKENGMYEYLKNNFSK